MNSQNPLYSICMCNYNMADTLEIALKSILDQIDARFEVVLVDDGSSDDSVTIVQDLAKKYENLRVVPLLRDAGRKLGETRNESIRQARGEYVLLHLDCDDITAPHIQDFVKIFHDIEKGMAQNDKPNFLLCGRPIQMARRDFLTSMGPYNNIHRGEDRDLWNRLCEDKALLILNHVSLKQRMPKPLMERIRREIFYRFDYLKNDFRRGNKFGSFIRYEFKYQRHLPIYYFALTLVLAPFAFLNAKMEGPLQIKSHIPKPEERLEYNSQYSGTYEEIMKQLGVAADDAVLSSLTPQARKNFLGSPKNA